MIGSFSSYQGSWPTGLTNKTSNKTDQDRIKIQLDHLDSTQGNKHLETKLRVLFHNQLELIWVIYTVKDLLLGGNGKPRSQLLFKLFSVLQRKWLIRGRFFGQIKYSSRYEWMYSIPQSWTWKILERQLCSYLMTRIPSKSLEMVDLTKTILLHEHLRTWDQQLSIANANNSRRLLAALPREMTHPTKKISCRQWCVSVVPNTWEPTLLLLLGKFLRPTWAWSQIKNNFNSKQSLSTHERTRLIKQTWG